MTCQNVILRRLLSLAEQPLDPESYSFFRRNANVSIANAAPRPKSRCGVRRRRDRGNARAPRGLGAIKKHQFYQLPTDAVTIQAK
jgi:hypothetical protein